MLIVIFLVFALVIAIIAAAIKTDEPLRARLVCISLACFFAAQLAANFSLLPHMGR